MSEGVRRVPSFLYALLPKENTDENSVFLKSVFSDKEDEEEGRGRSIGKGSESGKAWYTFLLSFTLFCPRKEKTDENYLHF